MEDDDFITIELPVERFYVRVDQAAIRDIRLSLAARGMFALLKNLPRDWAINITHLKYLTGLGKHALQGVSKELRGVGALEVLPRRLTAEQAAKWTARAKAKGLNKSFRAGQVAGKIWRLHAEAEWAVEAPLKPPKSSLEKVSTESPVFRQTEKSADEKSANKNNQEQGNVVFLKKEQQQLNNNVVVFFEAAGEAGQLLNAADLQRHLGDATTEQALWAGMAFQEQAANARNPGGLGTRLAQMARAGRVGRPKAIHEQGVLEKKQKAVLAYQQLLKESAARVKVPPLAPGSKLPRLPRSVGRR